MDRSIEILLKLHSVLRYQPASILGLLSISPRILEVLKWELLARPNGSPDSTKPTVFMDDQYLRSILSKPYDMDSLPHYGIPVPFLLCA